MTNQIQCTYELKITPGKADEIRQIANDIVAFNEEGEPNTLVYNVYMSPDETHFTFLETWADADAGLFHAERFGEGSFVGEIVARTDGGRRAMARMDGTAATRDTLSSLLSVASTAPSCSNLSTPQCTDKEEKML